MRGGADPNRGVIMNDILLMMVIPFIVACVLLVVKNDRYRAGISLVGAALIMISSVWVAFDYAGKPQTFEISSEIIDYLMFGIEVILGLVIIYLGIIHKKYIACVLGIIQLVMSICFEFMFKEGIEVEDGLYIDDLSIIMILIIGIIGSLICVYAVGYMRDFQREHADDDRRRWFFFLLFLFLSAMYGIVLSNNLVWMFFFWEITTLCSFALIGYTKTEEAVNNSFRQLILNLMGGIAFLAALIILADQEGFLSMEELLATEGGITQWVMVAVMLLCLAGIVKSAQMPFHTWLLGAMVAPTPTSALLHSSTMVKAGVFMVLKLSPLLGGNVAGYMVMAVGGLTFMLASFAAISQSNAKRVLAYSTIANLGLVVACAGVGTPEAAWAGIMLMVFHAITKSLMFLCVGTAEHHIGSRNIEDMDGLFERMPRLALIMMVGVAAMFLAPFGMLISKWAAFTAFVDASPVLAVLLILCLVFGSAATGFYWTKWLGKLSGNIKGQENVEGTVTKYEWGVLGVLVALVVIVCLGYPLLSEWLAEPWLEMAFGVASVDGVSLLSTNNMYLLLIMLVALILIFVPFFGRSKTETVPNYLNGVNIDDNSYEGSMGATVGVSLRNWYMEGWFGEDRIRVVGEILTAVIIVMLLFAACGGWLG